jgi:L-lactate dehydrogenase complex protein LldG
MSPAREEVLGAIRRALGDREGSEGPPVGRGGPDESSIARGSMDFGGSVAPQGLMDLLEVRISDYQATVYRCDGGALPNKLQERLRFRGVERLVVPSDLPEEWTSGLSSAGFETLRDGDPSFLSAARLASVDAVVTGCALAIAETGTLVLDGGPGQGRRAISLLPDYHLCVVVKEQVIGTVPEAITRLKLSKVGNPGPLTLISGPSATSDIELVRVEGVHGPRTLDVILVENH